MYDLLKAVHIVAIIVWLCGMIASVLILSHGTGEQLSTFQRFNRMVISPAMVIVWIAGIAMAVWYGWLSSGWLSAKLVFVLILSGLHGFLSAKIRKASGDGDAKIRKISPLLLLAISACALVIVLLAFSKPF